MMLFLLKRLRRAVAVEVGIFELNALPGGVAAAWAARKFLPGAVTPQSARGLAHSKTLRAIWELWINAPASWTAVALYRFSPSAFRVVRVFRGSKQLPRDFGQNTFFVGDDVRSLYQISLSLVTSTPTKSSSRCRGGSGHLQTECTPRRCGGSLRSAQIFAGRGHAPKRQRTGALQDAPRQTKSFANLQRLGLRRQAKRDAAFARANDFRLKVDFLRPKALSPLRSASALHDIFRVVRGFRGSNQLPRDFGRNIIFVGDDVRSLYQFSLSLVISTPTNALVVAWHGHGLT